MRRIKRLSLIMFASILLFCNACTDTLHIVTGEYTYQASGQVTLDNVRSLILEHEMGTMDILYKDPSTLLLTFYSNDGNTYTTDATIDEKNIDLFPFTRLLSVKYTTQESSILGGVVNLEHTEDYQIGVYGSGIIYDNTIIFRLQYLGNGLADEKKLVGDEITLVARKK